MTFTDPAGIYPVLAKSDWCHGMKCLVKVDLYRSVHRGPEHSGEEKRDVL